MNKKIKNIGIYAHVDAGKTTLTEQLLFSSGAKKTLGRVDDGNTSTDSMFLEKERGISIYTMPTSYEYQGYKINIIDTPGHIDFIAEVERSMLVLDGAILVISAKEGVQSHTKLLFETLTRMKVPTMIFINKIDRMGVSTVQVVDDIKKILSKDICLMQTVEHSGSKDALVKPIDNLLTDDLAELLFENQDSLFEKYIEGLAIDCEVVEDLLKKAIISRYLCPIYLGSALKSIGIEDMVEGINKWLPNYKDEVQDLAGVVFKVLRLNGKVTRGTMVKLIGGRIDLFDYIDGDKVTSISKWVKGRLVAVDNLTAGDIGILVGLNNKRVGDYFGLQDDRPVITLGKPTLKVKIQSEKSIQRPNLLQALSIMEDNDPYLCYQLNEFNKDIYIDLFGYVQMEIIGEVLKRQYDIPVVFEEPMTILKEKPLGFGQAQIGIFKEGLPFSAGIGIEVEPLEEGAGIVYESKVSTGDLQQTYQNALWDGIKHYVDQGLHGWHLTDIKITLYFSEYNSVSSKPMDYRHMAPMVMMRALKEAGTELMWPINEYKLRIPVGLMSRGARDIREMGGSIESTKIDGEYCIYTGSLPVDTSTRYEMKVHEYSSGEGFMESKLKGYVTVPEGFHRERTRFKVDPLNEGKYLLLFKRTL